MSDEEIPENFTKIVQDFLKDIKTTFPELSENILLIEEELKVSNVKLFLYCKEIYPQRFFDILYQNEEIFEEEAVEEVFEEIEEMQEMMEEERLAEREEETREEIL